MEIYDGRLVGGVTSNKQALKMNKQLAYFGVNESTIGVGSYEPAMASKFTVMQVHSRFNIDILNGQYADASRAGSWSFG